MCFQSFFENYRIMVALSFKNIGSVSELNRDVYKKEKPIITRTRCGIKEIVGDTGKAW